MRGSRGGRPVVSQCVTRFLLRVDASDEHRDEDDEENTTTTTTTTTTATAQFRGRPARIARLQVRPALFAAC